MIYKNYKLLIESFGSGTPETFGIPPEVFSGVKNFVAKSQGKPKPLSLDTPRDRLRTYCHFTNGQWGWPRLEFVLKDTEAFESDLNLAHQCINNALCYVIDDELGVIIGAATDYNEAESEMKKYLQETIDGVITKYRNIFDKIDYSDINSYGHDKAKELLATMKEQEEADDALEYAQEDDVDTDYDINEGIRDGTATLDDLKEHAYKGIEVELIPKALTMFASELVADGDMDVLDDVMNSTEEINMEIIDALEAYGTSLPPQVVTNLVNLVQTYEEYEMVKSGKYFSKVVRGDEDFKEAKKEKIKELKENGDWPE